MTKDEFIKGLPWITDDQVEEMVPSLTESLTEEELAECAREHVLVRLEQLRNCWIEGSEKSEEEVRSLEAKYIREWLDIKGIPGDEWKEE
jgi:hypothetical protein